MVKESERKPKGKPTVTEDRAGTGRAPGGHRTGTGRAPGGHRAGTGRAPGGHYEQLNIRINGAIKRSLNRCGEMPSTTYMHTNLICINLLFFYARSSRCVWSSGFTAGMSTGILSHLYCTPKRLSCNFFLSIGDVS